MADTAHSIAPQTDPSIIVERNGAFGIMRPSYEALHGLTLEMIRVVTAALNELAIDPAIGHVGSSRGRESSPCGAAVNIAPQLVCSTNTIPEEVRAVIINKRHPPRWSSADLKEIRERAIAALSSPKADEPVFPSRE